MRAEGVGGEVADWIALIAWLLETRREGIQLLGGRGAGLVTGVCRASAVTVGSAVLFSSSGWRELSRKSDAGLVLLAHELVHVRQYRERGPFRFLWAYGREYLAGRWRGLSHQGAYRAISFEEEARRGEAVARHLLKHEALLRGN